jgi:serine/threonine protein kinase
MIAY